MSFSINNQPTFLIQRKMLQRSMTPYTMFSIYLILFYLIDLIEYRSTFSPIITACMNFIKLDHKSNINRHCRMSYKNTISRVRSFLKCGHGSLKYKVGFFFANVVDQLPLLGFFRELFIVILDDTAN